MRSLLLAVTSQVPWPLDRGGHLRSYHLLKALAQRYRVRLVAGTTDGPGDSVQALRAAGIELRAVPLPRRTVYSEFLRVGMASAGSEPYVCYRRHDWTAMRRAVSEALSEAPPDLFYLDHLDSYLFADLAPSAPTVVDLHNVYSKLVARTADDSRLARRWYLRRESHLLERIERRVSGTADALFVVSEEERQYFSALGARTVCLVPNGVDCARFRDLPAGRRVGPPVILYIGTLSWKANADAAEYLVREILPLVRTSVPNARVRLVGRDPLPEVLALRSVEGVDLFENAPDVLPHLRAAHVLAVPLTAGGGSRLKIVEAFAAGVPVASTPVGSEGLDVRSGEHLLIAPLEELATAVTELLQHSFVADRLAEQARRLVEARYDWDQIGSSAADHVASLLASRGAA